MLIVPPYYVHLFIHWLPPWVTVDALIAASGATVPPKSDGANVSADDVLRIQFVSDLHIEFLKNKPEVS